jgi:hypothetical protein
VRLGISGVGSGLWVHLEPETPSKAQALEACAARGGWTTGREADTIQTLEALATRLGYRTRDSQVRSQEPRFRCVFRVASMWTTFAVPDASRLTVQALSSHGSRYGTVPFPHGFASRIQEKALPRSYSCR